MGTTSSNPCTELSGWQGKGTRRTREKWVSSTLYPNKLRSYWPDVLFLLTPDICPLRSAMPVFLDCHNQARVLLHMTWAPSLKNSRVSYTTQLHALKMRKWGPETICQRSFYSEEREGKWDTDGSKNLMWLGLKFSNAGQTQRFIFNWSNFFWQS